MLGFLLGCAFPDSNAITVGADDPVWDPRTLPIIRVTVPGEAWKTTLATTIPTDDCADRPDVRVEVTYDNPETGTRETYADVGMRYRGHSALWSPESDENRWGYKLSFNNFRPGRRFHGMKSINLLGTEGDKSLLRERLALLLMAEAGVPAPRANHGRLFVNGTYLGLFPMVEEADDEAFLENHFGEGDGDVPAGSFYKVGGYCGSANLDYVGTDIESYSGYEARVDTVDAQKATDLIPMLACVKAGSTDAQVTQCLGQNVDLDAWRTELAVDALLFNVDGLGATGQNFLLYRPVATGKFVVIPYDLDLAWYRGAVLSDDIFDVRPPWEPTRPVLPDRLRTSDPAAYCARVLEVAEAFDPDVLVPRIEALRVFLGPDIVSDPFVQYYDWRDAVTDVLQEVEGRYDVVRAEARACDPPVAEPAPL